MRISDWSSDVCSSDLRPPGGGGGAPTRRLRQALSRRRCGRCLYCSAQPAPAGTGRGAVMDEYLLARGPHIVSALVLFGTGLGAAYQMYAACRSGDVAGIARVARQTRSEEHTSELQALMRIS